MNQSLEKKKVCKFKQKCPQFIAKQPCGFDHVQCKFKDTCRDKQKCMFYHSPKPVFDKPKSEVQCKFGNTCTKFGCGFMHTAKQNNPIQTQNINHQAPKTFQKINKPCNFGANCKKANCRFQHPSKQNNQNYENKAIQEQKQENQNIFSSLPKRQILNINAQNQQISQNRISFNNIQKRQQNRFCIDFMIKNQCSNQTQCSKLHEFTQKSSIKRLFFTTQIPQNNFNITFFQHSKQQQRISQQREHNNKEIIYVFQQNDILDFKKLISSENLYQQFGGIGSNQTNNMFLKSIKKNIFKAEGNINGIESFIFKNQQFLTFVVGKKLNIYNINKGQIISFDLQKQGNKLTGIVTIQDKGVLLISTSFQTIKCFQFNRLNQTFQARALPQIVPIQGFKKFAISETQLLGEKVIFGISSQSNKLMLMNLNLKSTIFEYPENNFINDSQLCLLNNGKTPVCLLSITLGSRIHQIKTINLLNYDEQTIMKYEFNSGLNKLFILQGQLFIQIKNKGLLVYKIGQFQNQIGMIPYMNQIKEVRKDNKGNLIILESNSAQSKGSLSIFKIRKI